MTPRMQRIHQLQTQAEKQELTASQRVFRISELRARIIDHCETKSFDSLRQVDKSFFSSMQNPVMWRRKYSPARISWPMRTIFTTLTLKNDIRPKADYQSVKKKHVLGSYRHEQWLLTTGALPNRDEAKVSNEILDRVAHMTATVSGLYRAQHETPNETIERERDRAFVFLLDRAYRLENGMKVATYRAEALWLAVQVALFIGLQATVGRVYLNHCLSPDTSISHLMKNVALGAVWIGLSMASGLTMIFLTGDDYTVKNLALGPVQKKQLNAWALLAVPD